MSPKNTAPIEGLDALITEWKEMDMNTLELAVDTGRKHTTARALVWMMRALLTAQIWVLATSGWGWSQGDADAAVSVVMVLASLCVFVPLMVWQARSLSHVDAALSEQGPHQLLEARLRLIDAAITDSASPMAVAVACASLVFVVGMAWAASAGHVSWTLPAAMAVAIGVLTTWSLTVRLPRLRAERDVVALLQQELADEV
jgi:hypothetical protein